MRFSSPGGARRAEGDMTPMIDMTFQLIAFFMVVINFTEMDRNELIRLPSSELAKPPEQPPESPVTLNVGSDGRVYVGPYVTDLSGLERILAIEKQMTVKAGSTPANATIVIRGDQEAKTGLIQEVIQVCQKLGFEKFVLRAEEQIESRRQVAAST